MNKEERFEISVNQEDVQNIIDCYEKDIKYIKKLENNWNELKECLEKDIKEYEESEFHIKEPPLTIQTKVDLLLKMQEIESRK